MAPGGSGELHDVVVNRVGHGESIDVGDDLVELDGVGDRLEFVVALRSGLLRDRQAWVYAGAGIMADSDPAAEYAETELKMQALLGALHGDCR